MGLWRILCSLQLRKKGRELAQDYFLESLRESELTNQDSCRIKGEFKGPQPIMPRHLIPLSLAVVALWGGNAAAEAETAPREMPPALSRKVDFAQEVKPILARSCTTCHANGKSKGGFNMDHIHAFVGGGDSGPAVVSGSSGKSLLIKLLLSNDPDERMPVKGDPLSLEEVAIMRAWIDQGMQWEKGFTFSKFRNAPVAPRRVSLPEGEADNPVDRFLSHYYRENDIPEVSPIEDGVFARRVFLDVLGLLPTAQEVKAFIEDVRVDKRQRLVGELLEDRDNYAEHWVTFWNDSLRNSYTRQYHGGGGKPITGWLKNALSENKPYDQFVRELINPVGGSEGFIKGVAWRGTVNASQVTEMQAAQNVAQVFMGLNIKCASCHDSFINDWTLKETYSFAAIFAGEPLDIHRCDKPTGEKAEPAFLYPNLGKIDPKAAPAKRIEQLAEIMTSPRNGRMARTMVNRLWAIFFGHGLIEPVDEMDNPAWNSDLLDWLAVDFAESGYDLKHTMSILLNSRAYHRPAVALDEEEEQFLFRGPVVRRMSAEQFLDGLDQVILAAKDAPLEARGTGRKRAGSRNLDRLMRTLGRQKRDVVVTRRESKATTAQFIELANGRSVADLVAKGGSEWLDAGRAPEELVGDLFSSSFGRAPSARELEGSLEIIGRPVTARGVEDLLWMLVMHPEFQLIK